MPTNFENSEGLHFFVQAQGIKWSVSAGRRQQSIKVMTFQNMRVSVSTLVLIYLRLMHTTAAFVLPNRLSPLPSCLGMTTKTSTVAKETTVSVRERLAALDNLPKLLVFDLDNTLWTPELYQIRQRQTPVVGKDIRLFPDVPEILQLCQELATQHSIELAIASRTNKREWAEQLLNDFTVLGHDANDVSLANLFQHVEIRTGSKKQHLANLRRSASSSDSNNSAAAVTYSSMLFFDDDARMNLGETSQLGVLSCHTPRGMTLEYFVKALEKYNELKTGHDDNHWMGYILNAKNLGIQEKQVATGKRCKGRVKFYSSAKRFGFVIDGETGQEFFVHESKLPMGMQLQAGDEIEFDTSENSQGRLSAAIIGSSFASNGGSMINGSSDNEMVVMPCFTMSQPFASLLLNGLKTVESRNNPMFEEVAPGTRVLLHCGRKDWHDQESYLAILAEKGYSAQEISNANRLPKGFSRGSIIGVITVGKTWKANDRERRGQDLQHSVLAPFESVGKFCTEVTDAQWLQRPVKTRGSPGVYNAQVPKDAL